MQISHRLSLAPMMDWSDHHCRYFWRLLTKNALLYTEMVTTGALIHGDKERFLRFNEEEHPVALQLGGSDPTDLARCAVWADECRFSKSRDEPRVHQDPWSRTIASYDSAAAGLCLEIGDW